MTGLSVLVDAQRAWFRTGATLPVEARLASLRALKKALLVHEEALTEALRADLGKSAQEAYMCEIGLALSEVTYAIRKVRRWARPRRLPAPLANFASSNRLEMEPYGVALIMSPWNYPVLLTLQPLVGALAAGNCAVLKPSAYSPAVSAALARLVASAFDPRLVTVVTGGREENQGLLDLRFDYIFFTGGVAVGRTVMERAARHLTPVTLELGGKSPVVVERSADLRLAARRIVFGKFLNCGQTCIAPDYVLVERPARERLVALLVEEARRMYGERPLDHPDYGKMINRKHFDRVRALMSGPRVVWGGECQEDSLRIAPTILDGVNPSHAVMGEEIFGPLLPVLEVEDMDEAYRFIQERERPLALYVFTADRRVERRFTRGLSFGGGCVNDTIMHIASRNLPFGGVGNSGMGAYHGRASFETFSRPKGVVKKYNWIDIPFRYPPYREWKYRLVRWFLR